MGSKADTLQIQIAPHMLQLPAGGDDPRALQAVHVPPEEAGQLIGGLLGLLGIGFTEPLDASQNVIQEMGLNLAEHNGNLLLRQFLVLGPQTPVPLQLDIDKDQHQGQRRPDAQQGNLRPKQFRRQNAHGQQHIRRQKFSLLPRLSLAMQAHHAPHQGQRHQPDGLGEPKSLSPQAEVLRRDGIKQAGKLGENGQANPQQAQRGHTPPNPGTRCPKRGPDQEILTVEEEKHISRQVLQKISQPVPNHILRPVPIPGPGIRPQGH